MNIYLIRHGQQNSKLCNVNVSLSESGKKQSSLLANRLSKNTHIDIIYSSDLLRAMETAQIINQNIQVPHRVVPEWREISFGELTGKDNASIKKEYAEFMKKRRQRESDLSYPGGENGKDVIHRVLPKLMEITKQPEKNVLIVTHGGVIRALIAYLLKMQMKNKLLISMELENTSITHIVYHEKENDFSIERLNDYAHLENEKELLRSNWKKSIT